ncbi:MAG: glycoside hydrolase family 88 protein [Bacteroidales bacterium]
MNYKLFFKCFTLFLLICSCRKSTSPTDFISENIDFASKQTSIQVELIEQSGKILNPRTIHENGSISYVSPQDWTSGFFPGSIWYLYELTGDSAWIDFAKKYTEGLEEVQYLKWHHDVGFMVNCSYGNGLRLINEKDYDKVIIQTAKSLSTRFRKNAGVIQSWDTDKGWQSERGWECPVIIDNMMNLELLFNATRLSGDSSFRTLALEHADKTLANHFREDNSCYHVIDYDTLTGNVRNKHTAQGYAHESAWARGQAWAIYGFTVCYRETKDPKYLAQAEKIYNYLFSNPNMPEDLIPYWDFDAPNIPDEPRDASAAAIIASALYELSTYSDNNPYKVTADKIMTSLGSSDYRAELNSNGNFILMHSVGSIPHNQEIDVPLNYADYYFLESLIRKRNLEQNASLNL